MKKSLVALVLRVGSLNMQNGKLNLHSIVKIGVFWTSPWPAMVGGFDEIRVEGFTAEVILLFSVDTRRVSR